MYKYLVHIADLRSSKYSLHVSYWEQYTFRLRSEICILFPVLAILTYIYVFVSKNIFMTKLFAGQKHFTFFGVCLRILSTFGAKLITLY